MTQAVAGSSSVKAWVGKKLSANSANSVGAQTPEYLADANGKKVVKFVTANNDYLFTQDATVVGEATGDDNAFTLIAAIKRGTPGVYAADPFAGCRYCEKLHRNINRQQRTISASVGRDPGR